MKRCNSFIFLLIILSFFSGYSSFAQTVFKGTKTNFNSLVKTDFNFTRTFATVGTKYISTYKLVDIPAGKQFGSVTG